MDPKEFYLRYLDALSGQKKTRELLEQFIADENLIGHILFFESIFPSYEIIVDELIAEGERVFVRSRMIGAHTGQTAGIPPTQKNVETPFALGYTIRDDKIVQFWAIADEIELFEQLGLNRDQVQV